VTTPERVTISADDVTVTTQPATASAAKAPAPKETRPKVVVIPAEKPTPVGVPSAAATGDNPDAASDVLHRLVPNDEPQREPLDDSGDLRARLARTAALKKPGSRERQDEHTALQDRSVEQ
jgi:hypothetical protein